jgi:hypothetical protein
MHFDYRILFDLLQLRQRVHVPGKRLPANSLFPWPSVFYNLVREDRSMLELYNANYSFLNQRLAEHYGIPNVLGEEFRKVEYTDGQRRGILGHGSILVQTSLGNRTSPVLRGKGIGSITWCTTASTTAWNT